MLDDSIMTLNLDNGNKIIIMAWQMKGVYLEG